MNGLVLKCFIVKNIFQTFFKGEYIWRCIRLSVVEQAYVPQAIDASFRMTQRNENHAITVSDNISCVFSGVMQEEEVEFMCSNNCDRSFRGIIENVGRKKNPQIRLVLPEAGVEFELKPNSKLSLKFSVQSKTVGESQEQFVINFQSFRVKRSISIFVCETEAEANAIRQNLIIEKEAEGKGRVPVMGGRNGSNRSRYYANQVSYFNI